MDKTEIDARWFERKPVRGVSFLLNDTVRVLSAGHRGESGSVIALLRLRPEPVYTVELGSGAGDIQVSQSALLPATGKDTGAVLGELARWYSANCDGDWEHQQGVKIDTLDNPGWDVHISLRGTALEAAEFQPVSALDDGREWIDCRVTDQKFIGVGGPFMLTPILETFLAWATSCGTEVA